MTTNYFYATSTSSSDDADDAAATASVPTTRSDAASSTMTTPMTNGGTDQFETPMSTITPYNNYVDSADFRSKDDSIRSTCLGLCLFAPCNNNYPNTISTTTTTDH